MPRRNSGGRSSSSGFSLPRRAATPPKPKSAPAPTSQPAPAPAPVLLAGSVMRELGYTIADGMAVGGGYAIANRLIDAVMDLFGHKSLASAPAAQPTPSVNKIGTPNACGDHYNAFKDCLNGSRSEMNKCQFHMKMIAECRKSSSSSV